MVSIRNNVVFRGEIITLSHYNHVFVRYNKWGNDDDTFYEKAFRRAAL